jgi:uncharacterized protein YcbK (DUF882 family)
MKTGPAGTTKIGMKIPQNLKILHKDVFQSGRIHKAPDFKRSEFLVSSHRSDLYFLRHYNPDISRNITRLAQALQKVRNLLGEPLYISSGYRPPDLNEEVGGVPNSYHLRALAADVSGPELESIVEAAEEVGTFVEIIKYDDFVHLAIDDR